MGYDFMDNGALTDDDYLLATDAPRATSGAGMDPARLHGGTPGDMEATGTPEHTTRGMDKGAEEAAGRAPDMANTATFMADSTRTQQVKGGMGTPGRDDRGSGMADTTQKSGRGNRDKG